MSGSFAAIGGYTPGLGLFQYIDRTPGGGATMGGGGMAMGGGGYAMVGGGSPMNPNSIQTYGAGVAAGGTGVVGGGGGNAAAVIRQAQDLIGQLTGAGSGASAGIGTNSTIIGGDSGTRLYSVPFGGESGFSAAGTTGSASTPSALTPAVTMPGTSAHKESSPAANAAADNKKPATTAKKPTTAAKKPAAKKYVSGFFKKDGKIYFRSSDGSVRPPSKEALEKIRRTKNYPFISATKKEVR